MKKPCSICGEEADDGLGATTHNVDLTHETCLATQEGTMHSVMTVGELINALRDYPENYRVMIGDMEISGVRKANVHEEGRGPGGAVMIELRPATDLSADPLAAPPTPRSRKPRD